MSGVPGPHTRNNHRQPHDVARNRQRVDDVARDNVVVRVACCTSTCGAVPETLIVSSSEPTFISALTVAVKFEGRSTPSRTTVPKPVSENVSL